MVKKFEAVSGGGGEIGLRAFDEGEDAAACGALSECVGSVSVIRLR